MGRRMMLALLVGALIGSSGFSGDYLLPVDVGGSLYASPTQDLLQAYQAGIDSALATCPETPPDSIPPDMPPLPIGGDCIDSGDCQYLNTKCVGSGFWQGWCVDELSNFRSLPGGAEGQMTHNANCLHRTVRFDKRTIRFRWDMKLDSSWISNCVAGGQHLGSMWAAFGNGQTKKDWAKRNVRVDFSRQCTDGFDVVIQGYKNDSGTEVLNVVMDTRINTRVPGAYSADTWRTTIVTATYDPGEGRVFGTVEYVGKGSRSFSHTDSDARDFPVFWNWYGYGNVDTSSSAPRDGFGLTVRNVSVEVF